MSDGDILRIKPKTRVPVTIRDIPFANIESIDRQKADRNFKRGGRLSDVDAFYVSWRVGPAGRADIWAFSFAGKTVGDFVGTTEFDGV